VLACLVGVQVMSLAQAHAGVHVDPNGPAGQEYSDSLKQARGENGGAGGGPGVPGSTEKAPLFGAGITPQSPHSSNRGQGSSSASAPAPAVRTSGIGDGGGNSKWLLLIPVVAVLLIGAGVALVARRGDRSEAR